MKSLRRFAKNITSFHLPGKEDRDVYLISSPRSGSTWLTEMILTQPGFKFASEPFDIRWSHVKEVLEDFDIKNWEDFHKTDSVDKIGRYLRAYSKGHINVVTPGFHKYHLRLVTRRIVFKILHALEDKLDWIEKSMNGYVVYLIRHPIPVSISRKQHPRLDALLETEYIDHFEEDEKKYARKIRKNGDPLQLNMLDWSLQNAVPLKKMKPNRVLLTYEQLVLDPITALKFLALNISLTNPKKMFFKIEKPSRTTHMSDEKTKKILGSNHHDKKRWLVEKWGKQIEKDYEKKIMEIPQMLGVDLYQPGSFLAQSKYWIK